MPPPPRESRSKKCSICGQPAEPGARLCVPCKSALKRARDTTVSEQMVPARRAKRRAASASAPVATAPVAGAPAPRPARWIGRAAIAFAALGVMVTAGAWLAYTRGNAGTIAPRYSVAPVDAGNATLSAPVSDLKATSTGSPAEPAREAPPNPNAHEHFDARTAPASIAVPRAPIAAPIDPSAATRTAAPTSPPEPIEQPLPPPVVAEAPPPRPEPDRWQRLSDELARCPGDVVRRTMCQETLRIEQCQGMWGRVPACPARAEREYGN